MKFAFYTFALIALTTSSGGSSAKAPEQAVIVHVPLSDGANGTKAEFDHLLALEEKLEKAITKSGAGELDGNEFGQGDFTYFMYGADADRLFAVVESILRGDAMTKKGVAFLRYGPPGSKQKKVDLSP